MDTVIFFSVLLVIYSVLFFFDRFFKSCMHYPYDIFLRNTGLSVGFLRIRWHTTALNRAVLRWGNSGSSCTRSFITKSFNIGVVVSFCLLPIGLILLIVTIFTGADNGIGSSTTPAQTSFNAQNVKLQILLPGVNLPLEEIGYYIATLMACTVIHELGHAMAAVVEDIPVTGFGFQIFFCLPWAYTEISSEHLNALNWFRKLRILCGGIWHNFLFVGICYLLMSSLSFTLSPLYTFNKHVIVTEVAGNSPLRAGGDKGLVNGNIITQINDCAVYNEQTWYGCLMEALHKKPGFCVSSDFIRLNDESIDISHHSADGTLQCCDKKNYKLCCFEYIDDLNNEAPVEIPQHVCLHVRNTIESAYEYCGTAGVCGRGFCLRPLLRNTTNILKFKRQTQTNDALRDVIYIGHPADVSRTVRVSSFVPKGNLFSSQWADTYSLFLRYNIVFSIGLALVNAIPCFGFDGYHIVNTIVNSFLVNRVKERPKRDFIGVIVCGVGTLLFSLAFMKVFWTSILRHLF